MNIGRTLWDMVIIFIKGIKEVWDFLSTEYTINGFEIFDVVIWEKFEFTPIYITGGVMVLLLGFSLISLFNPFN